MHMCARAPVCVFPTFLWPFFQAYYMLIKSNTVCALA